MHSTESLRSQVALKTTRPPCISPTEHRKSLSAYPLASCLLAIFRGRARNTKQQLAPGRTGRFPHDLAENRLKIYLTEVEFV